MKNKLGIVLCIAMLAIMGFALSAGCGPDSSSARNLITSKEDMAGRKIGVQMGTTGDFFASDFAEENPGTVVERFSKGADAILALKQEKVDAVLIDQQPAEAFVAINEDLVILGESFEEESYAIAVAKGNAVLLEQINEALAQLKADGTLDSIIANHIGDETSGTSPYVSPPEVVRENGTLTMATNATFPPYEYYDESREIVGIDVDIARAISDRLGMELVIEDMEFESIIPAVSSGRADIGMAAITVTIDRMQDVVFSNPYLTSSQVIIVRK